MNSFQTSLPNADRIPPKPSPALQASETESGRNISSTTPAPITDDINISMKIRQGRLLISICSALNNENGCRLFNSPPRLHLVVLFSGRSRRSNTALGVPRGAGGKGSFGAGSDTVLVGRVARKRGGTGISCGG